jgi:hypothetical protein
MHAYASNRAAAGNAAMTVAGGTPSTSRGDALVEELKWVHDLIRRDLRTVRRLAEEAEAGAPAEAIQAGVRSLAAGGPLWTLRINCLRYCYFVHAHHTAESALLFPALRRANPALDPVVDRLEADHRGVAVLLDEIDEAARSLGGRDDPDARRGLVTALDALATDLLAHLDYEEEHVSPTLRTWSGWPGRGGR